MIGAPFWLLLAGFLPAPPQDISLEELLRRAREAHAQAQTPIREEVEQALRRLDEPEMRDNELRSLAHNLAKLGPAAGPLLVPGLNPGDTVPAPHRARSERMLVVLEEFDDLGTALALLDVLDTGSPAHRLAALKALRSTTHRRIVAEALLPLLDRQGQSDLRMPALDTLSSLAGEESCLWLEACAKAKRTNGELQALMALARAQNPSAAPRVLANLRMAGRAPADQYWVLRRSLEYFARVPDLLASDDTYRGPLMALAKSVQASALPGQENEILPSGYSLYLNMLLGVRDLKLGTDIRQDLWDWIERYPVSDMLVR
ncbi:MAG: hypothetical protein KDB61_13805, partial [Planctomycetes bacterium]|nr:hypothetical protein [Planctomycetota bacterium]